MQPQTDNLVVRQHERVRCSLPCKLTIAPEHAALVALTPASADATGALAATLVDLSRGGCAIRTRTFLPKMTRLLLTAQAGADTLTLTLRVMRVFMLDRSPAYELGTATVDLGPADAEQLARIINTLASTAPATVPVSAPARPTTGSTKRD
jgi:hypothetical protein